MTFARRPIFLALTLLAAMLPFRPEAAAADDHVTIQIALAPSGAEAPLFYAAAKGWYKDAHLDVDILDGRGSMTTIQQIAAGQIDVGDAVLGAMATAVAKGAPIISIAGWVRGTDLAVLVPENSDIHTAHDLKGKTVLLFTSSPWVPFVDIFLKNAGLTRNDLTIHYIDPAAIFGAYAAGQGDGIMTLGAYTLPIINPKRASRAISAANYGVTVPQGGFFVSRNTLATKSDILARLVAVDMRALKEVYDGHFAEAADAVAAARPNEHINKAVIEQQLAFYRPLLQTPATAGKPLGWQAETDWQKALTTMEEAHMVAAGAKPSDYYTNEIIDKAVKLDATPH